MVEQFYRYDDPSGKTRDITVTHVDVDGNTTTENRQIKNTVSFSSEDPMISANVALGRPIYKVGKTYTANPFAVAPSVTLDKKTGDITVSAPDSVLGEDWFKKQFSENENLKKLSQAYKLNPDYAYETTDEDGNTVYKKAEELVNEYDASLKKAIEDLQTLYTERDRVLLPIYGTKVDKMSTEDIRIALTPTYNVGDYKVSGSTVISLPDFLINHPIFGEQIRKLSSFNAENGTVTRDDFMENFWNRNKNSELTAERIQELYQNLGTNLTYSNWDNVTESDYERHGSNQAAREIAFRNFMQGQDPEADFMLQAGDAVTSVIGGVGQGLVDWSLGVMNAAEWLGNTLTFWDGRDEHGIQQMTEAWDDWKSYNNEQLQLISDTSAAWTNVAGLVTELGMNIYTGNLVGGVVAAGLGAAGAATMQALNISQASSLGKMIGGFALALDSTQEAGQVIKNAIGAQKAFAAGGALAGSIVNITTQAIVDAALTDPVLFRKAIEGQGGEEAQNYLSEQYAWNVLGFGMGIGISKAVMAGAETKVGRAINAKLAKANAKLKTMGYNISDGIKANILHRSLEDTVAESAENAAKKGKNVYKRKSERVQQQMQSIKDETRAFAKADIDIFDGLKINEEGLKEAEGYIIKIKNLQNAVDAENRSLKLYVDAYDDMIANPEMAGFNKAMYNSEMNYKKVENGIVNQTGKTFTKMQGSAFSQEAANYIGAKVELKYMETVLGAPEYFSASTVSSAAKSIDSYKEAIAKYTSEYGSEWSEALDDYMANDKKWFASMNQYRASKGITNAQDLDDLLQSKLFDQGDYMRVQRVKDKRYAIVTLADGSKRTNMNIDFQHLSFEEFSDFLAPDTVQNMYKWNTAKLERNTEVLKMRLSAKSAMKDVLVSGEDTQFVKNYKPARAEFDKAADEFTSKFTKDTAHFNASELVDNYNLAINKNIAVKQATKEVSAAEKMAAKEPKIKIKDSDRLMAAQTLAPTDISDMLQSTGKSKTGSILQDGIDEFGDDAVAFNKWYQGLPDESKNTINKIRRDYNEYVGGMGPMSQAESLKLRSDIEDVQRELQYISRDETTRAWDDYINWQKMAEMEQPDDALAELSRGEAKNAQDTLERQMKHIGYDGDISVEGRAQFDEWLAGRKADLSADIDEKVNLLKEYRGEPKSIEFPESQVAKGLNRKNLSTPSTKKTPMRPRRQLMRKELGALEQDSGLTNAWFDGGDVSAKKEIAKKIEENPKLRDAMLSEMYSLSGSDLPYDEWLETPMEIQRIQSVDTLRNDDAFLSFSMNEDWNGPLGSQGVEGDRLAMTVRPKDTYGSVYLGSSSGEKEVLVPRDVYRKAWDSKVSELQTNVDNIKMEMESIRGKYAPASDADYPGFKVSARDDGNMGLLSMLDESDPKATREGTLRDYYRDYKGKEVAVVEMEPDEYNRLMERDSIGRSLSDAEKKSDKYYDKKFKDGERVPLVSIQYDEYGKITGQEGRHRSAAAGRAGIEKMPVVIEYPAGKKPLKMYEYEDVTEKFVKKAETEPNMSRVDRRQMRMHQDDLANAEAFLNDYKSGKITEGTTLKRISRDNLETLMGVDPNLEDTINLQVFKRDKTLMQSSQVEDIARENKLVNDNFIKNQILKEETAKLEKLIGAQQTDEFMDNIIDFADRSIDEYLTAMKGDPKTQKFVKTISERAGESEDDVARYLALKSLKRNQKEINKQITNAFGKADKKMSHIGKEVNNAFDSMLDDAIDRSMLALQGSPLVDGEIYDEVKDLARKIEGAEEAARDEFSNIIATTDNEGRKVFMAVDPTTAKLFKTNIDDLQVPTNIVDKANKFMSKIFRLGTTGLNLSSTMRQWFRDSGNAFGMGAAFKTMQKCSDELVDDFGERIVASLSEYDYKQLAKRAEETGEDIKKLAVERELRMGQIAAGQTTEAELYTESLSKSKEMKNKLDKAYEKLEDIMNNRRENYLRNRVYANNMLTALNRGHTVEEARIIAEFAMNNATTNFSRKLVHLQRVADSTPYLSAAINGSKSFWRMATLDPVGVTTRIMGGFVIPQMYLTITSLADESNRKVYENLPEYTKSENLVFVQNGIPFTIPIPQELAFIIDPFRQWVEGMYGANKNNFWELAANDVLGAMPIDLSGFSAVDMDDMIADPTIFDRVERGVSKVFSQVAPIPIKSAYMMATGVDPYSGKKLRDKSWVVWNDDTGEYETMDYNQGTFSKLVSSWIGEEANGTVTEKVLSGIFGNTGMDVLDSLVATLQKFGGDENADPTEGIKSQFGRIGSSLTGEDYSTLNAEWQRAIAELEDQRDQIMNSKEMKDIQNKLGQDIDDNTRQKLIAKRKDLLADWQKNVANITTRLVEQGGTLDRYKFGAVVQLLNMNSVDGWVPSNKYLQSLNSKNYYAGRDEAYRTMQELGITGTGDYSVFGYLKYKDGKPEIVYNSPTAIITAGNLVANAVNVDKANIDAIIKKADLYTQREEMYDQINAIYNKSKLTNSDYNKIDAIKMEYNNKALAALIPYLKKVSPEAITNNEQVMDVLENIIQVPSAYEKVKNRYVSSGNGKLNKQQGFVRSYIKAILNKDNI